MRKINRPVRRRASHYNNTGADSIVKVKGGVGTGGIHGSYQGSTSTLWRIGGCIVTASLAGAFAYFFTRKKLNKDKSDIRINENKLKSELRKEEASENSRHRMNEAEQQCELDIRKAKEFSSVKVEEIRSMYEARQEFGLMRKRTVQEQVTHEKNALGEWQQWFNARFPIPVYSAIPPISTILDGCPDDFKPSMFFHLLSVYGALCFSNVRARYMDGRYHSPSLQVVIEGEQGSGKSTFRNVYDDLFQRVIMKDRDKARMKGNARIIQTVGIGISKSRFTEIVAGNHNVYLYAMETEIDSVLNAFRKNSGLSSDLLRKAFSNEAISLDNQHTPDECRGVFPVYLNYTFTGTPKAVSRFFKEEEYEDGTASRICFCVIPELGVSNPEFELPEGAELERMRDQIDDWRDKYCFITKDGIDISTDEHRIDVSYVFGVLKNWSTEQRCMGDKVRSGVSLRIATIAFHGAMVLHMFANEPGEDDKKMRKAICKLTIYIANHCMERFLCRYYKGAYPEIGVLTAWKEQRELTEEEIEHWYPLRQTLDENGNLIGYGKIAKQLGVSKDDVRNAFIRYERQNGLR